MNEIEQEPTIQFSVNVSIKGGYYNRAESIPISTLKGLPTDNAEILARMAEKLIEAALGTLNANS